MIRQDIERLVLAKLAHDRADEPFIRRQLDNFRIGQLCDMYESPVEIIGNRAVFSITRDLKFAVVRWAEEYRPAEYVSRNHRFDPSFMVMSDIKDYRAVAVDVATGTTPVITSRSRHREFLKRNGFIEVGNEAPKRKKYEGDHNVRPELERVAREILARH